MKRKLLIIVIFLMLCSSAFSKPKKLQIELIRSQEKIFDCPQLNPDFEFVSMFYNAVCFNRNLLNLTDKETLRNVCKSIYQNIIDGHACLMRVKKFLGNQNLEIKFEYFNDDNILVITSNYDTKKNKIISYDEDREDTWALGYYIENGTLIYFEDINKQKSSPEEKLKRNLAKIEGNTDPILYINIAENYYEMGKIEEGIKFLDENKAKAIELSPENPKPGNIKDVIAAVEEEGKVLLELNQ